MPIFNTIYPNCLRVELDILLDTRVVIVMARHYHWRTINRAFYRFMLLFGGMLRIKKYELQRITKLEIRVKRKIHFAEFSDHKSLATCFKM